jgi:hypothetical protein
MPPWVMTVRMPPASPDTDQRQLSRTDFWAALRRAKRLTARGRLHCFGINAHAAVGHDRRFCNVCAMSVLPPILTVTADIQNRQLSAMYGRRPRCKGKESDVSANRSGAAMYPAACPSHDAADGSVLI